MGVAVVGASGFLGRRVVAALERDEVVVHEYTRSVPFLTPDGRPEAGLASASTVLWLATRINPVTAEREPERVQADRMAFTSLLLALRDLTTPPTVVLVSSGGTVYDPATAPPYAESAPTGPVSTYGRAKLALERLLAEQAPGRHVTLRVSNAYGPGQAFTGGQGVIAHWLRAAAQGEPIHVYGDPETTRDYVYVDDVAEAFVAVARTEGPLPEVVNIGSGRPTTLGELAETVLEVAAVPGLEIVEEERRSFDVSRTWLDVSLAEAALGWRPVTPLGTGVRAAWQDALARC